MNENRSGPMAGRTVVITGSTAGIGKATALGLAALGAHIAITGRDRDRAETAAAEIRAVGGGQVDVFVADLSDQAGVHGARRLPDASVTANVLHPGVTRPVSSRCPDATLPAANPGSPQSAATTRPPRRGSGRSAPI
jgi:shikimate 5-dehydrogenase